MVILSRFEYISLDLNSASADGIFYLQPNMLDENFRVLVVIVQLCPEFR